ncbi:MAG: hypothetical protein IJO99_05045 [Ruminococcus sp.]|nr:hypothetical protein [Ruminococcus sp.]
MKKLISLLTSITLCFGAMSALPVSAKEKIIYYPDMYSDSNSSVYQLADNIKELVGYTNGDIYQSLNVYSNGHAYVYTDYNADEDEKYCSTFHIFFEAYSDFDNSDEELEKVRAYIAEQYPEFTIEEAEDMTSGFYINYNKELSDEEKFEIALDIKKATGVSCDASYLEDVHRRSYLGDLSSDNALTPVDASMLLSYYADSQSGVAVASAESGADYSIIGDFNGDGAVTPSDASEILSYYADQQTA